MPLMNGRGWVSLCLHRIIDKHFLQERKVKHQWQTQASFSLSQQEVLQLHDLRARKLKQ